MMTLKNSPALLISVKDASEAETACNCGVDLIDIKNPDLGSLGMADLKSIEEIAARVSSHQEPPVLSAALGEAIDWFIESRLPKLPPEISWCKLGLAGCGSDKNWTYHWHELRQQWDENSSPVNWVAVVYADWSEVNAPAPYDIIDAAISTRCAGVLLDTCQKDGRNLFDHLTQEQLKNIAKKVHRAGLPLAIAGGLSAQDFPKAVKLRPEILGFRTAACDANERRGTCSPERIHQLRNAMQTTFRTAFV